MYYKCDDGRLDALSEYTQGAVYSDIDEPIHRLCIIDGKVSIRRSFEIIAKGAVFSNIPQKTVVTLHSVSGFKWVGEVNDGQLDIVNPSGEEWSLTFVHSLYFVTTFDGVEFKELR